MTERPRDSAAKNGVLVCLGTARTKNIGDYVQSLAARQFAGLAAVSVEREALDQYAGDPVRLVMNGWFMHHPDRFPPTAGIIPLFVSFHVKPKLESRFFTPETVAYLKAREPIGCRSTDAVEMLRRHGIRAEFTSCLTLTLGESYRHVASEAAPVFVDPYLERLDGRGWLRALVRVATRLPFALRHLRMVVRLARRLRSCYRHFSKIDFYPVRLYYAAEFYRVYSPVFPDEVLLSADYLSHAVVRTPDSTDEAFERRADELLRRYERAPYVVTGRLHCALPCLGIGTPVWMTYHPGKDAGRFGGNLNFLNVLTFGSDGRCQPPLGGKIALPPPVRTEHLPYAKELARRCREFMAQAGECHSRMETGVSAVVSRRDGDAMDGGACQ